MSINIQSNIDACENLIEQHKIAQYRQEGALIILKRIKDMGITELKKPDNDNNAPEAPRPPRFIFSKQGEEAP